jgi:G:T-mismatch repair DNA endonuclease (very short patch repair protein)
MWSSARAAWRSSRTVAFWHRCPERATDPKTNPDFWREKFERNVRRDEADNAALKASGWTVIRICEHEPPAQAARRVAAVVAEYRARHAGVRRGQIGRETVPIGHEKAMERGSGA